MNKNGGYWKERFQQMEEAQNHISASKARELKAQFERAQAAINGKINAWCLRFAGNNGVSMAEARRMLSAQELKELQWNVEDYIRYGEENAINHAWEKQLENASARVHISRLEALKLETQQELEKLYGNLLDSVDNHIRDVYTSDFYHTAFEIQKGIGVGSSLQKMDWNLVGKIVSKPWAVDGKNFSDRIWESKTKLVNQVHNSLTRMCITGEAPDLAIREIAENMKVSRQQAGRLVMTESAAFANQAREDCMNELGVEEFEVVETLDSYTCSYCQGMDGKHFPLDDFQIGVTAPPFHPNCRGCTCPYFDDEFTEGEERAARGEDGKTYYVPADTSYEDWESKYIETVAGKDITSYNNAQMKISFPDDISKVSGITPQIREELDKALDKLSREYEINLHSLTVEPAGKGDMFITGWYDGKMGVVVNKNIDFKRVIDGISKKYNSGYFAGKSLEDYVAHEMFHVMLYQDCKNERQYRARYRHIEGLYERLQGISGYADKTKSGNEALAEAFVRMRNGEKVPLEADVLVNVYAGRWKK